MGRLDLNGYPELGGVGQWAGTCHGFAGKQRPGRSADPVSAALLDPRSSGHARSVADLAVTGLALRAPRLRLADPHQDPCPARLSCPGEPRI
jgi:hypothetical protein